MSNQTLESRPAVLVTGGTKRIGAAITRRLAAAGWRVLAHTRDAASEEARALAASCGAEPIQADLAVPGGAAALFAAAVAAAPELAFIVNSAAAFAPGPLPPGESARMAALNTDAPEKLTSLLGLRLLENPPGLPRRGAVVDLLDAAVRGAAEAQTSPYAASKAALAASMRKSAGLFADSLRVNAVAPGAVLPPPCGGVPGGDTLLPERPSPDDVAYAVEFLLKAGGVTGQTILVDSGRFILDAL